MAIGVRKALGLSCVCVFAASGLLDCGGKGSARPGDSVEVAGKSSGGVGGAGGAAATAGTRSIGGAGSAGAAGAAGKGCAAPTADGFATKWVPPQTTPGACTAEQIAQEYALCENGSPKYDRTACRGFNADPANSTCLGCMFSAFDGDVSGAVLVLPGSRWLANIGGCQALIDGDSSPTSCGARQQASSICQYDACINACASDASEQDWTTCRTAAVKACAQYTSKTSCSDLPRYAACHLMTFAEYFSTFSDLFCGSGSIGSPEGGAGGADGTSGAAGAAGAGGATL